MVTGERRAVSTRLFLEVPGEPSRCGELNTELVMNGSFSLRGACEEMV